MNDPPLQWQVVVASLCHLRASALMVRAGTPHKGSAHSGVFGMPSPLPRVSYSSQSKPTLWVST